MNKIRLVVSRRRGGGSWRFGCGLGVAGVCRGAGFGTVAGLGTCDGSWWLSLVFGLIMERCYSDCLPLNKGVVWCWDGGIWDYTSGH